MAQHGDRLVDAARIEALPPPVRRCLERSGVVGHAVPAGVTVRQEGQIRSAADRKWLRFTATEVYRVDAPEFIWTAGLKIGALTAGRATDSLENGVGRMRVKLLGLFTPVDATGPEMDRASLMRWLNETMWFPAVWATDLIRWEEIDNTSARATVTSAGITQTGTFIFDDDDRLTNFRADRERDTGGGFEMTPWSTPLTGHEVFNGVEVPSAGAGLWSLPDGDFEYIQLVITGVEYSA
jgi:hypothetical protein